MAVLAPVCSGCTFAPVGPFHWEGSTTVASNADAMASRHMIITRGSMSSHSTDEEGQI